MINHIYFSVIFDIFLFPMQEYCIYKKLIKKKLLGVQSVNAMMLISGNESLISKIGKEQLLILFS